MPARPTAARRAVALLAAVVLAVVAALTLTAGPAVADTASLAGTGVAAFDLDLGDSVGAVGGISPGEGRETSLDSYDLASGSRVATRATGGVDDAVGAGSRVGDPVPDPVPVRRPSGAPNRDSPWYVSYRDADGNIHTVGNADGLHAEVRIQQMEPGAPMSRPFGWRTVDKDVGPEWVPGTVCPSCQSIDRSLFPPNVEGFPGGPWDDVP